eukprot:COSAG05_NODE_3413_length_2080_cov_11.682988_1_plen_381_part_00
MATTATSHRPATRNGGRLPGTKGASPTAILRRPASASRGSAMRTSDPGDSMASSSDAAIGKARVSTLKAWASARDLSVDGKKAELVARLLKWRKDQEAAPPASSAPAGDAIDLENPLPAGTVVRFAQAGTYYVGKIVQLMTSPGDEYEMYQVTGKHTGMKLPLRVPMLEAIFLDVNFSSWVDTQDIAAYTFLLFVGVRIGHVAVDAQQTHALRFEDFAFYPSFANCNYVYVHFRSTKTRPRAADTPYWSSLRAQPHLLLCPVKMIKRVFALNFRGDASDFVFRAAPDSLLPLPRKTFTRNLKLRLAQAQRHLSTPFDVDDYSGISFRKGFLTVLGAAGLPGYRLAAAADHANIQSSTPYMLDHLRDRAANSDVIGAAFSR